VVEDGRAIGVVTPDGFVRAKKLVASGIDVNQTFEKLLEPAHVPAQTRADVAKVEYQDATLFNVHLALNGLPRYRAAAFDPDVDRAWIVNVGYETLADFEDDFSRVRRGALVEPPRLNAAVNSLYDPTDAPEGKATGLLRVFAPYAPGGDAKQWKQLGADYATRSVERWAAACTNLDRGLIRRIAVETPEDIAERMINYRFGDWMVGRIHPKNLLEHRPTDELSTYRTPIAGLYLCGASQHPHGYITFAPGYNCLSAIADDHGLERWWARI
jgi:phytoene dehydrogenase-like protein